MVEQLQKDRDSDMFSFAKGVSRVLKGYITNGANASEKVCSECKAEGLVYIEGMYYMQSVWLCQMRLISSKEKSYGIFKKSYRSLRQPA